MGAADAEEVVVAYDGDKAGENAFRRALPLLLPEKLAVRRARFPEGHDPDSLRLAAGVDAVTATVHDAADAVIAEIERLTPDGADREPQLQAKAAKEVTELLRPIPDAVLRYGYARVASDRLGLPADLLSRRVGGERRDAGGPAAGEAVAASRPGRAKEGLSWNVEKVILAHLLEGTGTAVPPFEELPPPQAFLDTECRNIYQTFCALYAGGAGTPPDARAVLARLGSEGRSVDLMANILLEGNFASGSKMGLLESLDKLQRRWADQRQREIAAEIREAERKQDRLRLERLLQEKDDLNRTLHRRNRPGTREGSA